MHVILAGGGIGGLTAALALAARSIEVTVLEQSPVLGEVGAGLQLAPNATRLLFELGLEPMLRAIACAPEAAEIRGSGSRRLLMRTELGRAAELRWGAPYLQVHRADLQSALLNAVRSCGERVRLRLDARLDAFEQDENGVAAGGLRGDALIGCDGVRSRTRALLWGETGARFTGQTAWRGLVRSDRLDRPAPSATLVWAGRRKHFVHYPVRGGSLVNFVGVVEHGDAGEESWSTPGDPAAFHADFGAWPEPVSAIASAAEGVWRYPIHDRAPLPVWSRGRVSLLGDAAHAAPPFLAQGAAMAIEDAEALARHLGAGVAVHAALQAYEAERQRRTARVQAWSRRNGRLFHLPTALSELVFTSARALDRASAGDAAAQRLDWLYGYAPPRLSS